MPSVAPAPIPGRKRRREDEGDIDIQMKLCSSPHMSRHSDIKMTAPRHELQYSDRRHITPYARRYHESSSNKRLRVEKGFQVFPRNVPPQPSLSQRPIKTAVDLSPCHICRRKPTIKSELDDYADCEGCGERTCFICMRECQRLVDTEMMDVLSFSLQMEQERKYNVDYDLSVVPDNHTVEEGEIWGKDSAIGHRRTICSRCCVERGTEGEVLCFGCLRAAEVG